MIRKRRPSIAEMFDVIPSPNTDLLRREIRNDFKGIAEELAKLSRYSLSRSEPQLPGKELVGSLLDLVLRYREISRRRPGAPNYRVIRDMCSRWPKYNLDKNLQRLADRLQNFKGRSISAEISSRCALMSEASRTAAYDRWRSLIHKTHTAGAADLEFMAPLMPVDLRRRYDAANTNDGLTKKSSCSDPSEWRDVLALSFQEALCSEFKRERIARFATKHLTKLFDRIGTPDQRLRVQGYTLEQVDILMLRRNRQNTSARVRKYRLARKIRQRSVTLPRAKAD